MRERLQVLPERHGKLMKLLASQIDEASLAHLGEEVVSLLKKRNFPSLAERFGYALAFDRNPATAIEEELKTCLAACHGLTDQQNGVITSIVVKYFNPNESGLLALVECIFDAAEGCPVLAELIVSSDGEDKYVTLEQISPAAA